MYIPASSTQQVNHKASGATMVHRQCSPLNVLTLVYATPLLPRRRVSNAGPDNPLGIAGTVYYHCTLYIKQGDKVGGARQTDQPCLDVCHEPLPQAPP